jgi:hypothetical protein
MGCAQGKQASNTSASSPAKNKSVASTATQGNNANSNNLQPQGNNNANNNLQTPEIKMSASAFDSVIVRSDPQHQTTANYSSQHYVPPPVTASTLLSPNSQLNSQQDDVPALATQPTNTSSGFDAFSFFSKDATHKPLKLQPNSKLNNTIKVSKKNNTALHHNMHVIAHNMLILSETILALHLIFVA